MPHAVGLFGTQQLRSPESSFETGFQFGDHQDEPYRIWLSVSPEQDVADHHFPLRPGFWMLF